MVTGKQRVKMQKTRCKPYLSFPWKFTSVLLTFCKCLYWNAKLGISNIGESECGPACSALSLHAFKSLYFRAQSSCSCRLHSYPMLLFHQSNCLHWCSSAALNPFPRVLIWPNHLFHLLENACTLSDISFSLDAFWKAAFKTKISGRILTFCNVRIGNIACLGFGL